MFWLDARPALSLTRSVVRAAREAPARLAAEPHADLAVRRKDFGRSGATAATGLIALPVAAGALGSLLFPAWLVLVGFLLRGPGLTVASTTFIALLCRETVLEDEAETIEVLGLHPAMAQFAGAMLASGVPLVTGALGIGVTPGWFFDLGVLLILAMGAATAMARPNERATLADLLPAMMRR